MLSCAVVIPVYSARINCLERIAFDQCFRVLGRHPVVLVAPQDLDIAAYTSHAGVDSVQRFPARFFRSRSFYSRLLLSPNFYRSFSKYKYILIHQLDALVFSDQLAEWCERGYDYVGAPWPDGVEARPFHFRGAARLAPLLPHRNATMTCHVGNGGFSLRNVKACYRAVTTGLSARLWPYNEDTFFALLGSLEPTFRVPPVDVAMRFAFEARPQECYEHTGHTLPFGAHKWYPRSKDFYRPFLEERGYELP